ncbi:MAG: hypothetical protein P4L51_12005 [Puia sp.]|nr:hypothetical protein [Puia sp.]
MNLVQLIDHLKNMKEAEKFIESQIPGVEFGQIDIYLKDRLDINSEVNFFDAETIENKAEIEIHGQKYINLFPLCMMQEMVEAYKNKTYENITDIEIAKKLLEYRAKDA